MLPTVIAVRRHLVLFVLADLHIRFPQQFSHILSIHWIIQRIQRLPHAMAAKGVV
jgi:hypothetical protein